MPEIERLQKALTGLDLTIAHLDATNQIDWHEIAVIVTALNADYSRNGRGATIPMSRRAQVRAGHARRSRSGDARLAAAD